MVTAARPPAVIAFPFDRRPIGVWYGWIVLGATSLVMTILFFIRHMFGIFFLPLAGEFGWSRTEISGAYSASLLAQALSAPLLGIFMDRWGSKRTLTLGTLLCGAALLLGGTIRSLPQLYVMNGLFAVGFTAAALIAQNQIVSNWFRLRRGLAMGISNASQGLAPLLISASAGWLLLLGWRGAYLLLAGGVLLLGLPAAFFLLKETPREKGSVHDAPFWSGTLEEVLEKVRPFSAPEAQDGPAERPRKFYADFLLVCALYGIVTYTTNALIVHLVPLAHASGLAAGWAAALFGLWGVALFAGNLMSGISDRLGKPSAYALGSLAGLVSMLFLSHPPDGAPLAPLIAGALLSGLSLGLLRPAVIGMMSELFAGPRFGRVNGFVLTIVSVLGGIGPLATGYLFDMLGSYKAGFGVMAGLPAAGIAGAMARRVAERPRRGAASSMFEPYRKAA